MPTTDRTLPEWIEEEEVGHVVIVRFYSADALYRHFEKRQIQQVEDTLMVYDEDTDIWYEAKVQ